MPHYGVWKDCHSTSKAHAQLRQKLRACHRSQAAICGANAQLQPCTPEVQTLPIRDQGSISDGIATLQI